MTRINYYRDLMKDKSISNEQYVQNGVILEELITQRREILEEVNKLPIKNGTVKKEDILDILKAV